MASESLGRGKRTTSSNQRLIEEPWTINCLASLNKVFTVIGACKPSHGAKSNTDFIKLVNKVHEDLQVVKKKLVRGDFINAGHFERELKVFWSLHKP